MCICAVVGDSSQLASAERDQGERQGPLLLLAARVGSALLRLMWLWGCEQSLGLWDHRLGLTENHKGICLLLKTETCGVKINEGLTNFVAIAEEMTGFNIYIHVQAVPVYLDCRCMKRKALVQPN